MIDRLKRSSKVSEIVLCTSTEPEDDELIEVAQANDVLSFRGSPDDVLERMLGAADHFGFDYLLSITADCPLVDPEYADLIVEKYLETSADLIRQFDLPHGAFSYGIKVKALRKVVEIKDSNETEVWGRYFSDTGLFEVLDMEVTKETHKQPGLRMTLDYPEDFHFLQRVFEALYKEDEIFSLDDILDFLAHNPDVAGINSKCGIKFKRRFDGQSEPKLKKTRKVERALIVGCGSIGQRHAQNLRKLGIEEIFALRTRKGHFQNLPDDLEVVELNSENELKDSRFDFAIISNPSSLHLETVEKISDQVSGIFIEKPFSDKLHGCAETADMLSKKHVVSFVGHNLMFHPAIKGILAFINQSDLGRILNLQCQVGQWLPDWHPYEDYRKAYYARKDLGGGVSSTMIHEIHLATQFAGLPTEVFGVFSGSELLELDVDVCSDLMIRHSSMAVSQIHLDFIQKPLHRSGRISFERGWASYDFNLNKAYGQDSSMEKPRLLWDGQDYDPNQAYLDELAEFIRYVEEGRIRHEHDAASSIGSMQVLDSLFESVSSGTPIRIHANEKVSFF